MELEELEEQELEIDGEHGQADWVMEQAIKFMRGAFENLKARKALALASQPANQPRPASAIDGATASTGAGNRGA